MMSSQAFGEIKIPEGFENYKQYPMAKQLVKIGENLTEIRYFDSNKDKKPDVIEYRIILEKFPNGDYIPTRCPFAYWFDTSKDKKYSDEEVIMDEELDCKDKERLTL